MYPHSLYAEAEAQLAAFGADQKVMIHINIAETGRDATLGACNGFAVSAIREAPSLRDFILAQLDRHTFNGPRGDNDKHDDDQIARIEIEEYY